MGVPNAAKKRCLRRRGEFETANQETLNTNEKKDYEAQTFRNDLEKRYFVFEGHGASSQHTERRAVKRPKRFDKLATLKMSTIVNVNVTPRILSTSSAGWSYDDFAVQFKFNGLGDRMFCTSHAKYLAYHEYRDCPA